MNVNFGIGMLMFVVNEIFDGVYVMFQLENGLFGIGLYFVEGMEDVDLINVGKEIIIEVMGVFYFDSVELFVMIRGGYIDLVIFGGMEVFEQGDLVNWMISGKMVKGMGGVMDFVNGVKWIVVIMEYVNKYGELKVKKICLFLLIGQKVVYRLIMDLVVFDFDNGFMILFEFQEGVIIEEVYEKIEVDFVVSQFVIK